MRMSSFIVVLLVVLILFIPFYKWKVLALNVKTLTEVEVKQPVKQNTYYDSSVLQSDVNVSYLYADFINDIPYSEFNRSVNLSIYNFSVNLSGYNKSIIFPTCLEITGSADLCDGGDAVGGGGSGTVPYNITKISGTNTFMFNDSFTKLQLGRNSVDGHNGSVWYLNVLGGTETPMNISNNLYVLKNITYIQNDFNESTSYPLVFRRQRNTGGTLTGIDFQSFDTINQLESIGKIGFNFSSPTHGSEGGEFQILNRQGSSNSVVRTNFLGTAYNAPTPTNTLISGTFQNALASYRYGMKLDLWHTVGATGVTGAYFNVTKDGISGTNIGVHAITGGFGASANIPFRGEVLDTKNSSIVTGMELYHVLNKNDTEAKPGIGVQIEFHAQDANNLSQQISEIQSYLVDTTHGTEDGAFKFRIAVGASGPNRDALVLNDTTIASELPKIQLGLNANAHSSTQGIAIGQLAQTYNTQAVSIGVGSITYNNYDIAIGSYANSTSGNAISIGRLAKALGSNNIAIGQNSQATASTSLAIGSASYSGATSIAIGNSVNSSANYCTAIGSSNFCSGGDGIAFGRATKTTGSQAMSIGYQADSTNSNAISIGVQSNTTGIDSIAIGRLTESRGTQSIAIGLQSEATTTNAIAIGNIANATFTDSIAIGRLAKTNRTNSVSVGSPTVGLSMDLYGWHNAYGYRTNGTDYAEVVPKASYAENLTSGDIVGILDGKATKQTTGSYTFMVVSGPSAGYVGGTGDIFTQKLINNTFVLKNETVLEDGTYVFFNYYNVSESYLEPVLKGDFTNSRDVIIAFTGQIEAKVTGICKSGDWVVISGLNDGFGKCIDYNSLSSFGSFKQQYAYKVGEAWQSSNVTGVKKIKIKVGR